MTVGFAKKTVFLRIIVQCFVEEDTSGIPTGMHLILFSKPLSCDES